MARVLLDLPDDLAERARTAGLLNDASIGALLREAMRCRAADRLLELTEPIQRAPGAITEAEARELVEEAVAAIRSRH